MPTNMLGGVIEPKIKINLVIKQLNYLNYLFSYSDIY